MTKTNRPHLWVRGESQAARATFLADLELPPALMSTVDAHRWLRGPYTAGGTLIRRLAPGALAKQPSLVHAHEIEVLTVAPELRGIVPATRETLTSLAVPAERTRFYSRLRTLRIAHGLTELIRDHVSELGPRSLIVENAEHADPTDAELLSVLARRIDPALLRIVVCTGTGQPPDERLVTALTTYGNLVETPGLATDDRSTVADPVALATDYVNTECTSDNAALRAAYAMLGPDQRARLHDDRATELEAFDEQSLRLGAIPLHRERGADPSGAGADALRTALDYCIDMGFYHATVDFGTRGRAVIDWTEQREHWWAFTTKMTTSLAALGRAPEAETLYNEARAFTTRATIHMQAAYATAMLYTRHHEEALRDHRVAKAWINAAIAFASQLTDAKKRAFQTVFHRNGLALIEVHLGNLPEALRLVSEGLDHLARELDPDEHRLHRSVLRYNRGQVYAGLGRLEEAYADYTAVIEDDPNYAEYHFDRGNLSRRLGREADALADYETALSLSPPFPEVHYNRADVLAGFGDIAGALAGFSYVLELDPDFVDAYINRAGLHLESGDLDAADADVASGLRRDPDNAHLHVLRAQIHAERDDPHSARRDYDRAIELDPNLVIARAGRAILAFDQGKTTDAIDDLAHAIDLAPNDPELRYNRAHAYRTLGRTDDALADLRLARHLTPDDPDITEAIDQLTADHAIPAQQSIPAIS